MQHFHNTRLNLAKIWQKLSNNLNMYYLKISRFLNPRCHTNLILDIIKNVQKTSASTLMGLYD